ncbi:MAG TPA: hypothetical protein EYG03_08355 [Planctomycetes bacterium]|nr:hypothetical protein [Fuerstiella sp.]HIK91977.1 hypothetical protein [Planctomycetota bacterium]
MIMRSPNDDGFDFYSNDQCPPEWSVSCGDGIGPNWRFVPLEPGQMRRIDAAHPDIAAPHLHQAPTPAATELESDFNQAIYFG